MRRTLYLALACVVLSQALHGQEQSPAILKEYDQAIDQVAERAMQSVVEIEVTGYGVPESDKDQGQQQTPPPWKDSVLWARALLSTPTGTSSPTITWSPARCASG